MKDKIKGNTKPSPHQPLTFSPRSGNAFFLKSYGWIGTATILYIFLSIFTFSLHVSEGGDDSTYIIRALRLLQEGHFPSYQGPLYPAILSLIMAATGFSLGLLKISSWIFLTLSLLIFFKAYHDKVSELTLWGTIFMLVINHHFLYFGSQTYSEAFFMMLQGLFVLTVLSFIKNECHSFRWGQNLVLALLVLALVLTRSVGIAALPALLVFLLYRKQYKDALSITLIFITFTLLFLFLKFYIWDLSPLAGGQATTLFQKNPYDSSSGNETFLGFIVRFAENANLYLSKHFLIMIGLKPALSLTKEPIVTILLFLLFGEGMIRFMKKNQVLFFTGLYLLFTLGVTFFSLQTLWDQNRLIMPYFPFMVLFLSETIVTFTSHSEHKALKKLPLFILLLCFSFSLGQTIRQTDFSAIGKHLNGDRYYGYSPDWVNYLKMAEYISKELPENSYVACRKPSMACLYANGKKFYGIYRCTSQDPDILLTKLKEAGVTHIVAAHLRKNPRYNSGSVINTIHRHINAIAKKYPKAFIARKKIGITESAWLFEINYNVQNVIPSQENLSNEQSH